ncbi:MAG: UvrB/UvrC motif-containing protein [Planctomycetota bacterium]|jgi:protein arginine kinase activator
MKKCRQCSKPATLHITEVRKGEATEIHLCETCAKDYLQTPEPPEDVADFEFDKLPEVEDDSLEGVDDRVCPNCGITFKDFRSQGRLGCPHDYVEFASDLNALLENIHGENQHCGKLPRRAPDSSRQQHQLIRLRSELKTAIENENYEVAARLRDEIQSLEHGQTGSDDEATDASGSPE